MPSVIDWSSIGSEIDKKRNSSQNNGSGVNFLRMKDEGTYVFRPVGQMVQFYKIFANKRPVIVDMEVKDEAAKIVSEHLGVDVRPDLKFASYVIDRADGQIKVLEGNFKMLEAFATWAGATNEQPGGQSGGDWTIKATGKGMGGKNPRRYQTNFLKSQPLTAQELSMIESCKGNLPKLKDLFKSTPLDKIIEHLTKTNASEGDDNAGVQDVDKALDF
jgi:hypothetical protein